MECSGCGRWVRAGDVDVAGLTVNEVAEMEIFCLRCVYSMLVESRRAWRESLDENKALRETISILSEEVKRYVTQPPNPPSETPVESTPEVAPHSQGAPMQHQDSPETSASLSYADVVAAPSTENVQATPQQQERDTPAGTKVGDGYTLVRRKKRPRPAINIIGDSMVRNLTKTVKCNNEGSGCISLRGAGVKHVLSKACETAVTMREDGLLVLAGGGNSLRALGSEETAHAITASVKKVKEERKDITIAVVGVLPRPRENQRYEEMRVTANRLIQADLCLLKAQAFKRKEGDLSFLNMDSALTPNMFAQDGVHLNAEGDSRFDKRVLSWIEKERRL